MPTPQTPQDQFDAEPGANPSAPDNRPSAKGFNKAIAFSKDKVKRKAKTRGAHDAGAVGLTRTAGAGTGSEPEPEVESVTVAKPLLIAVIVLAVIAGALITLLITQAASCSRQDTDTTTEQITTTTADEWVAPYTWDNMRNDENGLLAYYDDDGNKLSEAGLDVSEHDGSIDWESVKAAGIDFAMIRLGYRGYSQGDIHLDEQFYNNITGASAAGIKVGVYFFSQALTEDEAREEAQYVIDTLANVNVELSYPIAFDEELHPGGSDVAARTDGLTTDQLTANAQAYLEAISAAGYSTIIYGNQHDLARLDLAGALANYDVWYAEYGVNHPTGEYDMAIWQYTETGIIPGVRDGESGTDINIRFETTSTDAS